VVSWSTRSGPSVEAARSAVAWMSCQNIGLVNSVIIEEPIGHFRVRPSLRPAGGCPRDCGTTARATLEISCLALHRRRPRPTAPDLPNGPPCVLLYVHNSVHKCTGESMKETTRTEYAITSKTPFMPLKAGPPCASFATAKPSPKLFLSARGSLVEKAHATTDD